MPPPPPKVQPKVKKSGDINVPEIITSKFEILEKLGKGSQGQVWRARRKQDGLTVAVKLLNIHSVTTWKQYELFQREAKILSGLNIEGIAPFLEYIEDLESSSPCVCIVQKFIEGETLASLLKKKHRFETEAIYYIIVQILKILQKLHSHKPAVIHRDIKPSNLILTPSAKGRYTVTLIDFGAVANPQVQNGGSTVAGTYGYMPPEQLMGQAQPASDIYAVAALAVELLSGVSPADIDVCDFRLVIEPYLTHIPHEVVQMLSYMLEPSVDNRICDYNGLISQFTALANRRPPSILNFLIKSSVPKLEDVDSICQSGNFEIWQNFAPHKDAYELKTLLDGSEVRRRTRKKGENDITNYHLYAFLISFVILPLMMLIAFIPVGLGVGLLASGVVSFGSFIVSAFIINHYQKKKNQAIAQDSADGSKRLPLEDTSKNQNKNKELSLPFLQNATVDRSLIFNVLMSGKKAVARITSIKYIPVDVHKVEMYGEDKQAVFYVEEPARFLVTYQYQLPKSTLSMQMMRRDTTLNSNLKSSKLFDYVFYGEAVVYTAPEDHYKVGDCIPLIFTIEQDEKCNDFTLYSMPYPYPFGSLRDTNDVVYQIALPYQMLYAKTENDLNSILQNYIYIPKIYQTRQCHQNKFFNIVDLFCKWGFSDAYVLKAKILLMHSQRSEALLCYQKAAEMGNSQAMIVLGDFYKTRRRFNKSLDYYIKAFYCGHIEVYELIITLCKQIDDKAAVAEWYQRAIKTYTLKAEENNLDACQRLVDIYLTLDCHPMIIYWGEKVFQLGQTSISFVIAESYYMLKKYTQALKWYLMTENPNAEVSIKIAIICAEHLGNYKSAFTWLQKALFLIAQSDMKYLKMMERIERTMSIGKE